MKIVAIIPARGKSKGIPRKNIISIGGKPLIAWTIEAALGSKYINKTIVTSEDSEILDIAKKYGSEILVRPKKYSHDTTDMVDVVKDAISQLKNQGKNFDILILLQPTSPLRDALDIDNAFEQFFAKNATALISGYEPSKSPYKSFRVTHAGWLKGIINNKFPFMNRQKMPPAFYSNGAIYIIFVDKFLKYKNFYTPRTLPFTMSVRKNYDLDTLEDVAEISKIIKLDSSLQ